MAKKIKIAGTTYDVPELDFNGVSDLADNGVDLFSPKIKRKSAVSIARAVVAWITDSDLDEAGDILQNHIVNGGDVAEITEAFNEAVEKSNFILALKNRTEKTMAGIQDHKKKQTKVQTADE